MGVVPKADGSHDNLDPTVASPRTVDWMEEIIGPMYMELSQDEQKEFVIKMAELLEANLRVNDPESELLQILDEHRRQTQGFC